MVENVWVELNRVKKDIYKKDSERKKNRKNSNMNRSKNRREIYSYNL